MTNRRVFLSLMSSTAAYFSTPLAAQTHIQNFLQGTMGASKIFSRNAVLDVARELAKQAFVPSNNALPEPFNALTLEQYSAIVTKPETAIWADDANGFYIEPLHRGYVYDVPVSVYTVENGTVLGIAYDQNRFNFGKIVSPKNTPDIAYSGLKILSYKNGIKREIALFQGATFFSSEAVGQSHGGIARGVSLKTGDPRGEEISQFRAFWIEKPVFGQPLVLHALADSVSLVAAFRFSIHANEITFIDTEVTFIARTPIDNIGFGGIQAMHFFSPASPRRLEGDIRASVHDANGLQILRGNNEWLWRPLNNPGQLQISHFVDDNIKGFGLVQRNRNFDYYQDDDHHYELKPTIWTQPLSDWGKGSVELIEIPTEADVNQNIVAFWRPKNILNSGQETTIVYRQFWCWDAPEKIDLAIVNLTRIGRLGAKKYRFLIEFTGNKLAEQNIQNDFKMILTNNNLGTVFNKKTSHDHVNKRIRVQFDLDAGNETLIELRLLLEINDMPQTETWLYRWTP